MSLQWDEESFEQIGQSFCFKCKQINSQVQYCGKRYSKKRNKLNEKNIKQMITVCTKLIEQNQFDNIVKIIEIKETEKDVTVYMEYCESNLEKELQNINREEEIINCIQQILNGFETLYKLRIQHRNIQAKKILIKRFEGRNLYLITDFFLSKEYYDMQQAHNMTNQGVDEYKAPELLFDLQASGECDIYSYGILFHKLCYSGKLPYMYENKELVIESINNLKDNPFQASEMLYKNGPTLKNLLERMIVYDVKKRISFKDLFNHSIININKDNIYFKFFVYNRILLAKYQVCQSVINEIKTKSLEWKNYILQQCVYLIGKSYLSSAKAILDYTFEDVEEQQLQILDIKKVEKFAEKLQKHMTKEQKQFENIIYQKYDENDEQMSRLRYVVKNDKIINSAAGEFYYQEFFFRPSLMIETIQTHQNRLSNIRKQFNDYINSHALLQQLEKVLNLETQFPPQDYLSIRLEEIR